MEVTNNGGIESKDRLSSLPDSILADIISLLELKSAIATCILSRRWRNFWTQLTAIRHDTISIPDSIKIITQIIPMILNSQPIHCFKFRCPSPFFHNPHPNFVSHFSISIHHICVLYVTKFDLSFSAHQSKRPFLLPSCVFESQYLETLKLGDGFEFKLPDNGIRLPNLRKLHVYVTHDDIGLMVDLFRFCPRLEKLQIRGDLDHCSGSFDITCPNLISLRLFIKQTRFFYHVPVKFLIYSPKLKRLHIGSVHKECMLIHIFPTTPTLLVQSEIHDCRGDFEEGGLIQSIASVKSLTLRGSIFSTISSLEDGVLPVFYRLDKLTGILNKPSCWKGLICLLDYCPDSRVLVLKRYYSAWNVMNWSCVDRIPTCLSNNVKRIEIHNLEGVKHDLELISLILRVANVLEILDVRIGLYPEINMEEKVHDEIDFCQEMCKFPRSSSNCQINFSGQYYSNIKLEQWRKF